MAFDPIRAAFISCLQMQFGFLKFLHFLASAAPQFEDWFGFATNQSFPLGLFKLDFGHWNKCIFESQTWCWKSQCLEIHSKSLNLRAERVIKYFVVKGVRSYLKKKSERNETFLGNFETLWHFWMSPYQNPPGKSSSWYSGRLALDCTVLRCMMPHLQKLIRKELNKWKSSHSPGVIQPSWELNRDWHNQ